MRRATVWLCAAALVLSACGDDEPAETTSAFEQLAASAGDEGGLADGAADCRRRAASSRLIVVEAAPCGGVDLERVAVAVVSDRLAVAAVTRGGPGPGWVFEGSVRAVVERRPVERTRTKVVTTRRKGRKRRVRRRVQVEVDRPPVRRTLHVRCTETSVALDVSDNHGPVRALTTKGVTCESDGRAVEVTLPLSRFVVRGAAVPAVAGRVRAALARRAPDGSRVRDVLDGVVRVRLDVAPCDTQPRDGPDLLPEVRCPAWSSPSSSAP